MKHFFGAVRFMSVHRIITHHLVLCLFIRASPRLVLRRWRVVVQTFICRNRTVFQAERDCKQLILSPKLFACLIKPVSWLIYICSASLQPLTLLHYCSSAGSIRSFLMADFPPISTYVKVQPFFSLNRSLLPTDGTCV